MYLAERTKSYFKENTWKAWLMMSHFQNNLRNVRALCTSIVCKPAPIIHSRYSTMVKINIKKMEGLSLTDSSVTISQNITQLRKTPTSLSPSWPWGWVGPSWSWCWPEGSPETPWRSAQPSLQRWTAHKKNKEPLTTEIQCDASQHCAN